MVIVRGFFLGFFFFKKKISIPILVYRYFMEYWPFMYNILTFIIIGIVYYRSVLLWQKFSNLVFILLIYT